MTEHFQKATLSKIYFWALIFLCSFLIVDFVIPTKASKETVQKIKTTQQNYYNGGGNSHFSYSLITEKTSISISKELKELLQENDTINIHRSLLLNEINKISHEASSTSEIYSLRWFTGMVFPLTALILFVMHLYGIKRISALVLIAQILLFADLGILITRCLSQ
jgi:hypothetical protein